ncbi:MAG TPA: flagellar hook-basal body complex protein FliE [Bryobacteraceae bacterium]|jgi:flagellar hook-basal body complex protein FliE|nr:flagellar hook-basal body complex protein FliE [Bryobacteraceae bacterium]
MAAPISPILPPGGITAPSAAPVAASGGGVFKALFQNSIARVENDRVAAQDSIDRFLSGEGEEIHKVALATQKAELSFDMFVQVRNKVVNAYQEIMRMQI